MKKKLCLMIILLSGAIIASAQSPTPIGRHSNLSIFSGYFAKQQNSNNNGSWIGVYGDIPLYRSLSEEWNISAWGVYTRSEWTNNMAPYSSKTQDFSLGLSTGKYEEFLSYTHSFYGGLAVGYKHSKEIGRVEKKKYSSESQQRDHLLVGNLNLNLMKYSGYHPYFLPRTQLVISGQYALDAQKTLSENGKPALPNKPWNKSFLEITLKQSLWDIPLGMNQNVFLQPKIGGQFSRYFDGEERNSYGPLIELALHKASNDDFLSLTLMHKHQGRGNDYLFIMLSLNLLKIFQ